MGLHLWLLVGALGWWVHSPLYLCRLFPATAFVLGAYGWCFFGGTQPGWVPHSGSGRGSGLLDSACALSGSDVCWPLSPREPVFG